VLAEPHPRQLGRISDQAQEYIRQASPEDLSILEATLAAIESGDENDWKRLPQSELLGTTQHGRVVTLMPNGDIVVWRDYVDYPHLYAIFYIGRASPFVG